jgi:hypothetical protein
MKEIQPQHLKLTGYRFQLGGMSAELFGVRFLLQQFVDADALRLQLGQLFQTLLAFHGDADSSPSYPVAERFPLPSSSGLRCVGEYYATTNRSRIVSTAPGIRLRTGILSGRLRIVFDSILIQERIVNRPAGSRTRGFYGDW